MPASDLKSLMPDLRKHTYKLSKVISPDDIEQLDESQFDTYLRDLERPEGGNGEDLIYNLIKIAKILSELLKEWTDPAEPFVVYCETLRGMGEGHVKTIGGIARHLRIYQMKIHYDGVIDEEICAKYTKLFGKGLVAAALLYTLLGRNGG